jgi:ribosomal protein S18 acetylase RimI-like enzyme
MSASIEYLRNKATAEEIAEHLRICDRNFVPPLSSRVIIDDYANKIAAQATRFEAWADGALVGLVAAYCNDQERRIAYITSVSVLKEWMGQGLSANLMRQCIAYAEASGMRQISLEVAKDNASAIKLYEKNGFVAGPVNSPYVGMNLKIERQKEPERQT